MKLELENIMKDIKELKRRNISSDRFTLRRSWSSPSSLSGIDVYNFKRIYQNLLILTNEEIENLKNNDEYKDYINAGMRFVNKNKYKENMKNTIGNYKYIIDLIKEKIEPYIKEQEQYIEEQVKKDREFIKSRYSELGEEEFTKVYGYSYVCAGKWCYTLHKFENTYLGKLFRLWEGDLLKFIEKEKQNYRKKEHSKIEHLIWKLEQKFSDLINLKFLDFKISITGIELRMSAINNNEKIFIETDTIKAGGHNVQRRHLRWLMKIKDYNKNVLGEIKI